ncbi:MAG TPA: zinc ribbon domain-containing protein, partial [bacterium]|nr:zinc ribbon domain-containing protein [bacterium]
MKCFFCQIPVPDNEPSCAACHRDLAKACPACALLYEREANFCMACGGKLSDRYAGAAKTVPPAPAKHAKSAPKRSLNERPQHITLTEIIIPDEPPPNGKDIEIDLGSLEESLHRRLAAEAEQERHPVATPTRAPNETIPPIDTAPEYEEDTALTGELSPQASEITFHEPERSLSPYLSHNTYPTSLQEISDAITAQIHDPVIPTLFTAIGKRITVSNGGFFTLEAPAGTGKGHFTAAVEQFVAQNPLYDTNIVVSTVNPFDFDYTIFIHLVRSVLNIKTVDQQQVRAKIDKYFSDILPAGKRESLTALLCLNFTPVQVKLPKSDLDYLLAFMCYWSARNKPILWVVDNAGQVNL